MNTIFYTFINTALICVVILGATTQEIKIYSIARFQQYSSPTLLQMTLKCAHGCNVCNSSFQKCRSTHFARIVCLQNAESASMQRVSEESSSLYWLGVFNMHHHQSVYVFSGPHALRKPRAISTEYSLARIISWLFYSVPRNVLLGCTQPQRRSTNTGFSGAWISAQSYRIVYAFSDRFTRRWV